MRLPLIITLTAILAIGCSGDSQPDSDAGLDASPDAGGDSTDTDPSQWTHAELMGEARLLRPESTNGIAILFVEGNHYQMGYQHGYLLKDKIIEFRDSLRSDDFWKEAYDAVIQKGPDPENNSPTYAELSLERAFDFVLEECRGLVRGSDGAVTLEECVIVNSLLWVIEDLFTVHLPIARLMYACSQFAGANTATAAGNLIHGRNMDLPIVDGAVANPLITVRKPEGKLKFVTMAWPSQLITWTGMNEAGLALAVNDHLCLPDSSVYNLDGVPHLHVLTQIMMEAEDLDQALAIVDSHQASGCSHFFMSHGPSKNAMVIEISPRHRKVRYMENDVVFATNHFLEPEVRDDQDTMDPENMDKNSVTRFTRLMERLTGQSKPPHPGLSPDASDYAFGKLDVPTAIDILRDPVDLRPDSSRQCYPCDEKFGSYALGNNYTITSCVFMPGELKFWMAANWDAQCDNPIYSPYVGFDLNDLFGGGYTEGLVPTYDPDYNCPTP